MGVLALRKLHPLAALLPAPRLLAALPPAPRPLAALPPAPRPLAALPPAPRPPFLGSNRRVGSWSFGDAGGGRWWAWCAWWVLAGWDLVGVGGFEGWWVDGGRLVGCCWFGGKEKKAGVAARQILSPRLLFPTQTVHLDFFF